MSIRLTVPIYLTKEFKTKKNKTISLNMNWYRNVHYMINNDIKKQFKDEIREQIEWKTIDTPIVVEYNLYWKRMSDLDNWSAVVTKYTQDALVEEWVIPADDFNHIVKNIYEVKEKDTINPRFEVIINKK